MRRRLSIDRRSSLADPTPVGYLIDTLRTTHIVVQTSAYIGNRGSPLIAFAGRSTAAA